MPKKLWGGRFKKKTDAQFERFSASLKWDRRLLPYEIAVDKAQVKALARCGVLSAREASRLKAALDSIEKKVQAGAFKLDESFEDVHSAVQAELGRVVGVLADKIHTGRSRNDLVSQSSRLYSKAHAFKLVMLLGQVQKALVRQAAACRAVLLPGMTHLQNAQILSQAHIFLAYAEMLERDKDACISAAMLADVCVLGSGALAGTTFKLDQALIARELGLSRVTDNSYDVSGDRDFAAAILWAAAGIGIHLSRIAEDIMIGQTKGFSLVDVDQSFCTGSSMMPQKKNADFVELVRGAAGVLIGNLTALMATLKGLPTSYNRDLQWDKRSLFESTEICEELLEMSARLIDGLKISAAAASALAADESLYATDLADYLVARGVPFREAHEQVGKIVGFAEENGVRLSKVGLDWLRKFAPKIEGDVYALFDAEHSVRMKRTKGSTHPDEINRQIARWKKILGMRG